MRVRLCAWVGLVAVLLAGSGAWAQNAAKPVMGAANGSIDARNAGAGLPAEALAAAGAVRDVHKAVVRLGRSSDLRVWPGFRPDTIPVMYTLPGHGTLLVSWSGALPARFTAMAGTLRLGWRPDDPTATAAAHGARPRASLGSRDVAHVVIGALTPAQLYALAVHETFHVFQGATARAGRRVGRSEDAMVVTRYPLFDATNEADVALEGLLLASGLRATTDPVLRARAREFLAVREARHRRLGGELAGFESAAELTEGLAQYAAIRSLTLAANDPLVAWSRDAIAAYGRELAALDSLTADRGGPLHVRFARTGAAMAMLLDRLAGPAWKAQLVRDDLTLQDVFAVRSGYRAAETELRHDAARQHRGDTIRILAATSIDSVRAERKRQTDSVLDVPGLLLTLATDKLAGGDVALCGVDPQTTLQMDAGVLLYTARVATCVGPTLAADFAVPVVHDRSARTLRATLGAEDSLQVTIAGTRVTLADGQLLSGATDLQIESTSVTLRVSKADVRRQGRVVYVRPH